MNERRDNIYIYLWEEFNTIYVGRTVNPKSRHYTHKHRETEKTYKFSSEHHVEHPKMVIIENDLTIDEGVEREKYWIEFYKENGHYNVLNITCGGQKGRRISKLTEEEKKQRQKEYYQNNKEEIKQRRKEYYQKNKKKITSYREIHQEEIKMQKKEYFQKHKEEIYNQRKRYKEEHKEEIKQRRKEYYQKYKSKN